MKIDGKELGNFKFEVEYKITSFYPEDEVVNEFYWVPGYSKTTIKQHTHRTDVVDPVFVLTLPADSDFNSVLQDIIDKMCNSYGKREMIFDAELKQNDCPGRNSGNLVLRNCLLNSKETDKREIIYKFSVDYYFTEGPWEFMRYVGKFKVPINYSGDLINDIKLGKFKSYGF